MMNGYSPVVIKPLTTKSAIDSELLIAEFKNWR